MAVAARKLESEYVYTRTPAMRVYTHRPVPAAEQPEQVQMAREGQAAAPRSRVGLLKAMLITCGIMAAAAVVLLIMVRYAVIAEQYSLVNQYRETIEENDRAMAELEVQLNSAVSLEEAREAALAAGLSHPTAAQIIHIEAVGTGSPGQ